MRLCIAHGGDVSEPSGGTDRITALAAGLEERGTDVSLVVPEPSAELPSKLEMVDVLPVDIERYGVRNSVITAGVVTRRAREIASAEDVYLQIEHSTLGGIATLLGETDFILDMHDLAFARFDHVDSLAAPALKRGISSLERRAVRRADHIIAVSEYMETVLRERWHVPEPDISVIANGYFPERITAVRDTDVVPGRISFLGTLHPKVDIDTLVALTDLSAVDELVVIGDGQQRGRLERMKTNRDLRSLQIRGRIPDEEAFQCVASSQAVVNPQTASELQNASSPVKLYYYAALGKPIVASSGPDILERLANQDAALVADSRETFLECVEHVLQDSDLAACLGDNARTISENFMWRHRVSTLKALYANLNTLRR